MRQENILTVYALTVGTTLSALNNFTKYDIFWLVFTLGGIFIMIGHSIFDQKVKHSFGKIAWMVVTSFVVCLFVKFTYDEGMISTLSMIISTLVASMVAPATFSLALKELPAKIAEQISALPEIIVGIAKRRAERSLDLKENSKTENTEGDGA